MAHYQFWHLVWYFQKLFKMFSLDLSTMSHSDLSPICWPLQTASIGSWLPAGRYYRRQRKEELGWSICCLGFLLVSWPVLAYPSTEGLSSCLVSLFSLLSSHWFCNCFLPSSSGLRTFHCCWAGILQNTFLVSIKSAHTFVSSPFIKLSLNYPVCLCHLFEWFNNSMLFQSLSF